MKRSPMPRPKKSLQRRTQMLRGVAPVRRTPLRFRSKKAAAIAPKRAAFVAAVLEERPWCEARLGCCEGRSVDVHEIANRSQGADILNPAEVLAVCRWCHGWITREPLAAEQLGLHEPGWAYRQRKIAAQPHGSAGAASSTTNTRWLSPACQLRLWRVGPHE